MRIWRFSFIATMMLFIAVTTLSQHSKIDPAFLGFWNLEVAKSDFAAQPKPKMGQVNWGGHGWVLRWSLLAVRCLVTES